MKNLKTTKVKGNNSLFWRKIKKNESISKHTTLGIGGSAKYFVEVVKVDDLKKVVVECKKNRLEYFVIGGGSDILASDEGYDGMLILNNISYIRKEDENRFICGSGTILQDFINFVIGKGYAGLEKMSGIPGTVGGAIYGNAGAYGQTISDHIIKVIAFDGVKKKVYSVDECCFDYRSSIFKKNKFIIIEAEFVFEKGEKEFLQKISLDTIQLRAQKYFSGIRCPGSYFKNVVVDKLTPRVLKLIPRDKITYGKIPAGFLLESVGAKGATKGDVKIADHHGNLIINNGNATAKDFLELANRYAVKVERKFHIELEPEVQFLGFKNHENRKNK
jgi:UDP-N-acetylmuramate dehydrogenase